MPMALGRLCRASKTTDRQAIGSKWVFKVKERGGVAKGFSSVRREHTEVCERHSEWRLYRTILALSALNDYTCIPDICGGRGEGKGKGTNYVCKALKSLYDWAICQNQWHEDLPHAHQGGKRKEKYESLYLSSLMTSRRASNSQEKLTNP